MVPYTSNTVNVLVVASFGQEVSKLLSTDGGTSFASSGTAVPGSNTRFRLNYKNTSNVPVSSVRLIDLLGKDAGASDWLIFNRTIPRGSQFDVSYVGNHASSLLPVAIPPVPTLSWAAGQNICLPPYVTTGGCIPTTWAAVPDRNIMADYGTIFSLAPNTNLLEDFDVGIPLTALNAQKVCNDFAAIASANFLLNGSPQSVALTPVAAPPVCLTIDTTHVIPANCCDSIKVQRTPGANGVIGCCAKIITTCKVKAIDVTVTNGYLSSATWNCPTPIPSGYVGQSTYTFAPNGCVIDLVTCVNAAQSGVVVINYVIYFENGEKCEKRIELDCKSTLESCCDSIKVEPVRSATGAEECCAKVTTTCRVKSVDVSITNGTFASTSWNCGTLPSGYVGQSSFTFAPNGCVIDMTNCVKPTQSGIVVITYVFYFENGDKCEKTIELDCKVASGCCDKVKLDSSDGDKCCTKLITECEVRSVSVTVTNGTIGNVAWNAGVLPSGYGGQSSFTFPAGNAVLEMELCVNAVTTGSVVVNYLITFANGEKCEKSAKLNCTATSSCCALVDFKLKAKWPFWKTQVGTFHVTNADPSVPICYIEISPSPSGIFTTSGLSVNGVASSQSWNPTRIPATGNLTPSAVNTVDFSLISSNYKGLITVCVVKCDGTKCCFEFKWTNSVLTDVDVDVDKDPAKTALAAVSISPVVNTPLSSTIKYVSFGFSDEKEVAENISEFYAISASANQGEDYPEKLASTVATFMGNHNAFFELSEAKRSDEKLGFFNLVFRNKLPKLGCTLYDLEGNILFSGAIAVSDSDTVSTSVTIDSAGAQGKMFEFMNLYPNPSNGSFQIAYATGNSRDVEIKLYSATGQMIHSQRSPDRLAGIHNVNVAVNGLAAGFYKVVLISDGEIRNKSLVIK